MSDDVDTTDWKGRWREGKIGFHQPEVNRLLAKFWPELVAQTSGTVFVPLCGKTLDMTWLAERGHQVVGVELSELAIRDYFSERGLEPTISTADDFTFFSSGGVEIWCGDLFAFPESRLADCVGVYDRASLIALPPKVRERYAAKLIGMVPKSTPTFLITLAYDQSEADGPPFSVPDDEVEALFSGSYDIQCLGTTDATEATPNLTEKGVTKVMSSTFAMRARP